MQIARRTRIGKPWPLLEMFKDKTSDSNKIVQNWLRPIVQNALRQKATRSQGRKNEEEKTFLDHLTDSTDGILPLTYMASNFSDIFLSPIDPEAIGYQVLNMLLAGRDTVGTSHL